MDASFDRCADHPSDDNRFSCSYFRIGRLTDYRSTLSGAVVGRRRKARLKHMGVDANPRGEAGQVHTEMQRNPARTQPMHVRRRRRPVFEAVQIRVPGFRRCTLRQNRSTRGLDARVFGTHSAPNVSFLEDSSKFMSTLPAEYPTRPCGSNSTIMPEPCRRPNRK